MPPSSERSVAPSPAVSSQAGTSRTTLPPWFRVAAYGVAAWSVLSAVLGLYWTTGGGGFPFGRRHDRDAEASLLVGAEPATFGPVIAGVGASGVVLALIALGTVARGRRAARLWLFPTGAAWLFATTLTLVVPDYRPLLAVVRAPVLVIGAPFGWPRDVDLSDFFSLYLPWPVLNQLVMIAAGVLWAVVAVGCQRHLRDACLRCGRTPRRARWLEPDASLRWGTYAVTVAVAIPCFYALTRWSFALGVPLGVAEEGLARQDEETPGIWWAGAVLATMAVAGATLTVGLVRPWGVTYPRWLPRLGGRTVRPRTALVPALAVAVLVTSAGLMYLRRLVLGQVTMSADTWGLYVPELFWPLWGAALVVAAFSYHLRRRGRCGGCGRS